MPRCGRGCGAERSAPSLARGHRCILRGRRRVPVPRHPILHAGTHVATSRLLLISDSGDESLATALQAAGHSLTADRGSRRRTERRWRPRGKSSIALDGPPRRRHRRRVSPHPRDRRPSATVPILALSTTDDVDDRIGLLEAGVDDVLSRPFDPRELDARIEALALRYQRSRDLYGGNVAPVITVRDSGLRRVIAVFSPKGGVGTTTVAVNVAVGLAQQFKNQVAIIDLDLQFGQVATHLNMPARRSIADLARDEVALSEPASLRAYADRHGSRPRGPRGPGDPGRRERHHGADGPAAARHRRPHVPVRGRGSRLRAGRPVGGDPAPGDGRPLRGDAGVPGPQGRPRAARAPQRQRRRAGGDLVRPEPDLLAGDAASETSRTPSRRGSR